MKTNYILILSILSIWTCYSQDIKMCGYQGYQTVEEVESACDLQGANRSDNNTEDAEEVVDAILDKVGLFRNFLIEECENINNALAVTMPLDGGDIDRYILYDLEFFKKVSSSTGTDWGLTSILAHEVGHHLNGHTLKSGGSNHKVELQADEFSGFVLARMKCSLEDAQSAISKLLPDEASSTHPAKKDRLDAIAKGWTRGNGNVISVKKIEEGVDEKEITAEMVLANYLEAIGGQEKALSVKTLVQKATMSFSSMEGEMDFKAYYTAPEKGYSSSIGSVMGMEMEIESVSKNGYNYNRTITNGVGEWTEPVKIKTVDFKMTYFTELEYLVKGSGLEFLGIVNMEGKSYYAVQFPPRHAEATMSNFTSSSVSTSTHYYNTKTGLLDLSRREIASSNKFKADDMKHANTNQTVLETISISDYRDVSGVLFPFSLETKNFIVKGNENIPGTGSKFIFNSIEINKPIDKELFETK
jgi:hypothetical protein